MNKFFSSLVIIATVFGLSFAAIEKPVQANVNGRKIIVFNQALNEKEKDELIARAGGTKLKNLDLIGAKAVWLPNRAATEKLKANSNVIRIDDDVLVETLDIKEEIRGVKKMGIKPQPPETLPWGIDRVDAELVWPTIRGAGIKVGVIDTGIDLSHPDLALNIKGGYNAINPLNSPNDNNGHGTHVAGIMGAVDNTIGVIGVGPQINLYAIKVLGASGSGYLSDVIEGLDWAIVNGMNVVNMSLGTSDDILSFREAVQRVNAAGIVQVAAAGNSGGSVIYPAAYPEVIAVSATNNTNTIASWSSRGPEVDLAAPGVSIYSTYKGQTYKTLSGTSMASPHVAGTAGLVLNTPVGSYDLDADDIWDPIEVQNKLQDKVVDLGSPGFDSLYGWGLVNAFNAVQP